MPSSNSALPELRRRQLQVGVLGCRAALGERREALVPERAQARGLLVHRSPMPAPDDRRRRSTPRRRASSTSAGDGLLEPGHALDPQPGALVRERALGDAPAVVERADEVLRGHERRR